MNIRVLSKASQREQHSVGEECDRPGPTFDPEAKSQLRGVTFQPAISKGSEWLCGEEAQQREFPQLPGEPRTHLQIRRPVQKPVSDEIRHIREQDIPASWEWDNVQHTPAVVELWLQRITMRVESISEGARRYWSTVVSKAMGAYQSLDHSRGSEAFCPAKRGSTAKPP